MSPERWQAIDELLQAALERDPAERAAFLAEACAARGELGNELRLEVESLLDFHQADDGFLETPPAQVAASLIKQQGTAELLLGRTLDRYELISALGRGGMGTVYLAQDTQLGRQVALKLLPRRFTRDPERVRRFRQEARAISALNHPNILTIYEIGKTMLAEREIHFLATEFVEGCTLRARLTEDATNERMTLGEALDVAIQTASALQAAHRTGIIHRDIKPENIMVRPDGLVKVLDFGLAKFTGKQAGMTQPATFSTVHTNPGVVMGTISYMSPEQARALDVDERSDLFSLGVVLYEMLTGRAPFAGATSGDVMVSILEREPPPLAQAMPQAPAALQSIINRALAKDCTTRYQQAAELLRDLKELKQDMELATHLKRSSGRAGDTPARAASLDLRVGQRVTASENKTTSGAEAAVVARTTQANQRRFTGSWKLYLSRFVHPLKGLVKGLANVILAAVVLAAVLAGFAINRYWLTENDEAINSVAVLPFVNVNADPTMDYLPDGITESLMQSLAQLPKLRVMARGAVFAYKGQEIDPRKAGKDLGVRAVVTGRVQRQGARLLITVELADARDGTLMWSEQYPRPFTDVQIVQTEIARELTSKLRLQLSGAQQRQLAQRYTQNSEAYQLYLLGRYHWNTRSPEGMLQSVEYFRQASEKDPGFALAYVGLADAYNTLNAYRVRPPSEVVPLARAAAERALQIDEQLADAHASLGKLLTDATWEWSTAEQQFKRALELNPNLANAHHWYATLLGALGRFDEAVAAARRADDLDAHMPSTQTQLGTILYRARRYDEALVVLRQTLERNPKHLTAQIYISLCYLMQQRYAEAIAELHRAQAVAPRNPDIIAMLGLVHGLAGQRTQTLRYQTELNDLARHTYVSSAHHSAIAAGLGDWDAYFDWMNKCIEEGLPTIRGLRSDPMYDVVRKDPRFNDLLRRAGSPF